MDIATKFDAANFRGDLTVYAGALQADADLQTAVLISLFTDRRAEPDDQLPDQTASRRGWWGDALSSSGRIGSRLWLLSREKQTRETVNRAREYTEEALAWLVDQGIAKRVTVLAEIVRTGVLGLSIQIERNQAQPARYRYELAWQQLRS